MADYNTTINYNGDGTTKDFAIPFNYVSKTDVKVSRQNGTVSYTWINPNLIRLSSPLAVGDILTIKRETAIGSQVVTFVNGAVPTAQQFNTAFNQTLFSAQESNDTVNRGLFKDSLGRYNATGSRIINAGDPTSDQDLVTKKWVETANTSAVTQAANSATAASASASAAATSATSATNSANVATTKATEAATSATSASASATTATTKATQAASSADAAATSAASVSAAAATANTKASEAAASATAANTSAVSASTSATSALNSANSASASANTASSKAADAAASQTAAATSAGSAATSATNAAASASTASTKAAEAVTSATAATTKASEAAASASAAATSATNAQFSEESAAAIYEGFDVRYLGTFTTPPTTDNNGNALITGALYWDSTSNTMKTWSGTGWLAAYVSLGDALKASNNLSDLSDAAAARTNIGLGNVENKSSATICGEITSTNVTTALGYTPYNGSTNPNGFLTSITSGQVTTALGYTPANKSGDTMTGTLNLPANGLVVGTTQLVASGGNVGIGTSAPGAKLESVSATAGAGGWYMAGQFSAANYPMVRLAATTPNKYASIGNNADGGFQFLVNGTSGAVGTTAAVIDSAGNVGIGTSTPKGKLQVNGGDIVTDAARGLLTNLYYEGGWKYVGNGYGAYIAPDTAGSGILTIAQAPNNTSGAGAAATPVERMRIDSAGNVGIGAASLGSLLEIRKDQNADTVAKIINSNTGVNATARLDLATGTANAYCIFALKDNGGSPYVLMSSGSAITAMYHDMASHIFRSQAGTEWLRIDSAGNVGIGTSAPGSKLTVAGNIEATSGGVLRASRTDSASEGGQIEFGRASDNVTAWTNDCIGTGSTPGLRWYNTAGTVSLFMDGGNGTLTSPPTYNNTAAGSTVVVTSTGLIRRTSSSIKYKKDVESLDPTLATNAINNLRPVWYRTKNPEGDDKATWSHIGLIAEEVHEVEPRLVRYRTAEVIQEQKPVLNEAGEPVLDEEGNPTFTTEQAIRELAVPEPEDVDYARLSVLLLTEVQSLRERIAALEARP